MGTDTVLSIQDIKMVHIVKQKSSLSSSFPNAAEFPGFGGNVLLVIRQFDFSSLLLKDAHIKIQQHMKISTTADHSVKNGFIFATTGLNKCQYMPNNLILLLLTYQC